jgi:hypothetical protein
MGDKIGDNSLSLRKRSAVLMKGAPEGETFAYITFFWQGVGSLFPWNALITSSYYFYGRLCGTPYAASFESFLATPFTAFQCCALALVLRYGNKFELKDLIISPLTGFAIVFSIMSALVFYPTLPAFNFFWITIVLVCFSGGFGAVLQAGIFGLAAKFPSMYTSAIMNGQALAGILASFVGLGTSLMRPSVDYCGPTVLTDKCADPHVDFPALYFFLVTVIVMVFGITSLNKMLQLPIAKIYVMQKNPNNTKFPNKLERSNTITYGTIEDTQSSPIDDFANKEDKDKGDEEDPFIVGGIGEKEKKTVSIHSPPPSHDYSDLRNFSPTGFDIGPMNVDISDYEYEPPIPHSSEMQPLVTTNTEYVEFGLSRTPRRPSRADLLEHAKSIENESMADIWNTISTIWSPGLAVMLNFFVTIMIFPSIVVHISSVGECHSKERIYNDLFVPCLFVLYNVADFVGRGLSEYLESACITPDTIWVAAMARGAFVPLMLTCNVRYSSLPVLFPGDGWVFLFLTLFGISNGYIATKAMTWGPAMVHKDKAQLAGTIMVCCLSFGLLCGAAGSFVTTMLSHGELTK